MSVGRILTLGLGTPFSAVKYLPTLGYGTAGAEPPTPSTGTGSSGGGRYRYYTPIPYEECWRELKQARAEKKRVEKQIKKVQRDIEDKQKAVAYEFNMSRLTSLIAELKKLQDKLEELLRMLDEIEEDEIVCAAVMDE